MKLDYKSYIEAEQIDFTSMDLLDSFISDLETYYNLYEIKPAPLLLPVKDYTEVEIKDKMDRIILKNFEIRFHNVGNSPYKRFFKYGGRL